jgi:Tol biopolymer transport system component
LTNRSYISVAAAATGALFAAAATHGVATSSGSTPVARSGQIAWKGFPRVGDESTSAIFVANPDGSHRRQLTHPPAGVTDDLPDWSPDGSHIVFERSFQPTSNRPTVADEVMRVNVDGSGLRQIGTCTRDCVANDDPQYSPDGHRIVFLRVVQVKGTQSLAAGVWLMDSNGGRPHQISGAPAAKSEDHEPAWSPDGKHIVFTRLNDSAVPTNEQALFIIASTGGTPRRITPWSLNAGGANWSPDGMRILFQSHRDCSCSETSQVYTLAADGSRLTRLTNAGRNIEPNWSPDGKKIIYAHQPGVASNHLPDLWVMDSTGKDKKALIRTNLWKSEPDWGTAAPIS